ncbi:unnamed protein product [Pneumocystis jirovecii]|uniref:U6 snRNA-associated Sm-like protein LSm1 n=2 Tax=Pneumocystis jirovecii TaxID=42068 RepID=L0PB27_PNEJI|nr:uncharacterized protein T551_02810 [Pneumocystis jirovecii RU7]KTW27843.1 hypothetical protein T551_02810 [Pneumocystis jirovecii RU7]CCJ28830.1 unnamed protein product [Pneumocystis jirovecii]
MTLETNPHLFITYTLLHSCLDKKLMVILRDGKKLIGILRSFDQYANLVLQGTVERIYVDQVYGDIPRGVFIIRGENVVLVGEIDLDKKDDLSLQKVSPVEAFNKQKIQNDLRKIKEKAQCKALHRLGRS